MHHNWLLSTLAHHVESIGECEGCEIFWILFIQIVLEWHCSNRLSRLPETLWCSRPGTLCSEIRVDITIICSSCIFFFSTKLDQSDLHITTPGRPITSVISSTPWGVYNRLLALRHHWEYKYNYTFCLSPDIHLWLSEQRHHCRHRCPPGWFLMSQLTYRWL